MPRTIQRPPKDYHRRRIAWWDQELRAVGLLSEHMTIADFPADDVADLMNQYDRMLNDAREVRKALK